MSSTYTQNLGIEKPGTGEQANTWGITVNRNMDTIDQAINGNTSISLSDSAYQLTTDQGATAPQGAFPLIIWGGTQTKQNTVSITPNTNQHIYLMSNTTTQPLAFQQGSGTQLILQGGCDAIIYCDGAGPAANVAQALLNPQFGNVLAQGNAQVNGTLAVTGNAQLSGNLTVTGSINGSLTTDTSGNVYLAGYLGVGGPTSVPDPLTVNGLGAAGQIRLVAGNYGVIFRNNGTTTFYLTVTASGSPYGSYGLYALAIDLATGCVGIGPDVGPNTSYGLNTTSLHAASLGVDGTATVGGALDAGGGANRCNFNSGSAYTIGLQYGGSINYVGTNSSGYFQVSNSGLAWLLQIDGSGNASLLGNMNVGGIMTVDKGLVAEGIVQCTSGGFEFPDGTVQTTAAKTVSPGIATINWQLNGTNFCATNASSNGGTGNVNLNATGGISIGAVCGTNGINYNIGTSSDARLKQNIKTLAGGLSVIDQLRPVRAEWNGALGHVKGQPLVSIVAQEIRSVLPEAVFPFPTQLEPQGEKVELLGLDPMAIIGHLILAIQQLKARMEQKG